MAEIFNFESHATPMREAFVNNMPEPILDVLHNMFAELERTTVANAVAVGETAPEFELAQAGAGERRSLSAALATGPVVLSFYRGQW